MPIPHPEPSGRFPDTVWRLTADADADGARDVQLILLPSGRIGAGWGTELARWQVTGDALCLFDAVGAPRAKFALAAVPSPELDGTILPAGKPCRLIYRRDIPLLPLPTTAPKPPESGRRNLVILRAGPDSLHPAWMPDGPEAARNWDLCLCTYGASTTATEAEHRAHQPGTKFQGIARLLAEQSFWQAYDYVWLPDDDLVTDGQTINHMFELCRAYGLALAQPSLAPGSFVNHPITARADHSTVLRFTSFVEIMAPIFSQAALQRVAASFALNASGYGLDHLWPAIIDAPPTAIAILDAVAVLHTRPIGASYDQRRAMHDGWLVEDDFHQVNRYEVRGAITSHPAGYAKRHGAMLSAPAAAAAA